MLTGTQASILISVLEAATSGNWHKTAATLVNDNGHAPADVIDAWKALEEIAGMNGTCPAEHDFPEPDLDEDEEDID